MRTTHHCLLVVMLFSLLAAPAALGQCPCSLWNSSTTPSVVDSGDGSALELGVKLRSDVDGYITGIRFYKSALNTGTHTGSLWTGTGTLLASVTFTGESTSGWQQVNFSTAIPITAGVTYIASYHTNAGHYSFGINDFGSTGVDNGPLHALLNGVDGPNGVYSADPNNPFPTSTYNASNYWVDVVFNTVNAPNVTAFSPTGTSVATNTSVTASFSLPLDPTSVNGSTMQLRDGANALLNANVAYDTASKTASLQPTTPLTNSATYQATVAGGALGVRDTNGVSMPADFSWNFTTTAPTPPPPTCPCSLWGLSTVPGTADSGDGNPGEYGIKFRADVSGSITGLRYYKSSANTGTHTAHLWTSAGQLLASATFSNETSSGWQQVSFSAPVFITAGTTYIASYFTPTGRYAFTPAYFNNGFDNVPLHAISNTTSENGVYAYSQSSTFPTSSFNGSNYWVDVVFLAANSNPQPTVSSTTPSNGATGFVIGGTISANFNEPMDSGTLDANTVLLADSSGNSIPGTVTYASATATVSFKPSVALDPFSTYSATIKGSVKDTFGNLLGSDYVWTFQTGGPPSDGGPGGPILVISSASNPFSRYYDEILRAEGMNEFTVQDISTVTASSLSFYKIAILGDIKLTSAQVTLLSNWVSAGGNLIAMHPDKQLAGMLGLTATAGTLANGYLLVDTSSAPGAGIVGQTIQFHGTADLYTLSGATQIAALYSNATTATPYPAVTRSSFGSGQVAAFTYDLARSVVYTRQGNPAWAGQERIGLAPIRTSDLFYGNAANDPQPNWIDVNKVQIPQADEQQRLLTNLIQQMTFNSGPLPRFWYLPSGYKAAVILTGDDHNQGGTAGRFDKYIAASSANCSVDDWQCVRSTSYVWNGVPLTDSQAAFYNSKGFEVALHVDSDPTCSNWTPSQLSYAYTIQLQTFAGNWPSVPSPTTHRIHCISWSDYDSHPVIELDHGMRLDTNFYWFPDVFVQGHTGMFTGSGMPMRFADVSGNIIDVYQATTQLPDEVAWDFPNAIDVLLDNALGPLGYYGVFTTNMHTDNVESVGSDEIVASAQARGVPLVSSRQMLTWLDGRNTSSFTALNWSGNVFSFQIVIGTGARNLQAMLPVSSVSGSLSSLARNGSLISYVQQTIKGVQYAFFPAALGSYQATYGGASGSFSISGTISGAGGNGATVTMSGPASGSVNASTVGSYIFSGLPNGTYTLTPTRAGYTFTPASRTLTVSGGNLTAVNFSSAVTTYSITGTISGTGGSGATVTLSGAASKTTTTNSSGVYTFTGIANGNYTVQPSRTGYGFTPASQAVTVNGSNITAVDFSSFATSFSVSGSISGTGGSGATVTLTGATTRTTTANSLGAYTFTGVPNGNYTVQPSRTGYNFSPTNQAIVVNGSNVTGVNFSSSVQSYTISGAISGAGGNAATVTLSGTASRTTTASTTGVYSFTALINGSYTVRPSKAGYSFTPTSQSVFVNGGSVGNINFSSAAVGLSSVSLSPTTVTGGANSIGTVTLDGLAPSGGAVVTLADNSSSASVPASVTVPQGSSSVTFTVATSPVAVATPVMVSATYGVQTAQASLTINPPALSSVAMSPTSVAGGASSTGTVTLTGRAPTGGIVVALSDNSVSANTPSSVTVLAGNSTVTFTVTTSQVTTATTATISANYNGTLRTATLTINPPSLSSLAVNPSTITGGLNSTGTVTLSGPAPSGGALVSLSDSSSRASVPSSVTIPAGSTSATFTITTRSVNFTILVTVSGTYRTTRSATLTLTR